MRRVLSAEEQQALATLARNRRVLLIIVPERVATEDVKALSREVNKRLDALAAAAPGEPA